MNIHTQCYVKATLAGDKMSTEISQKQCVHKVSVSITSAFILW